MATILQRLLIKKRSIILKKETLFTCLFTGDKKRESRFVKKSVRFHLFFKLFLYIKKKNKKKGFSIPFKL